MLVPGSQGHEPVPGSVAVGPNGKAGGGQPVELGLEVAALRKRRSIRPSEGGFEPSEVAMSASAIAAPPPRAPRR